jgi:hypothetical protein
MALDVNQLIQWLFGGISLSTLVCVLLIVLVSIGVLKIAKGILVQSFLLIMAWLPSVIIVLATDTSGLKTVIPLKGYGLILFPYTWDVLLGNFYGQDLGYVASLMLVISYIALLHLAVMFCASWKISFLYSPFIAYIGMVALGLGLVNTHKALYNWYAAGCIASGIHPLMPIIFVGMVGIIMLILVWGAKRRSVQT